jgi:hypothetical protein
MLNIVMLIGIMLSVVAPIESDKLIYCLIECYTFTKIRQLAYTEAVFLVVSFYERAVSDLDSSFIEGSHTTKNIASE